MTKCTVVIPTHNRPNYLSRILTYYADFKKKIDIIIADSSDSKIKKTNKEIITSMSNLDIKNLNFYSPKISPIPKMTDAIDYVKTKYCVFCADDDFVTPNGIHQSVEFLKKNPDFSVAHGKYFRFYFNKNRKGELQFLWKPIYPHKSINFEDPKTRLTFHLLNYYPTFYAVHRTNLLKTIYKETSLSKVEPVRFGELLPSALTLLYGKMKCLDVLYAARSGCSFRAKAWPSLLDMKKSTYDKEYANFRKCLSKNLCKNSRLTMEESNNVIDKCMLAYTSRFKSIHNTKMHKLKSWLDELMLPVFIDSKIRALYQRVFIPELTNRLPKKYHDDISKIRHYALLHSKYTKD